MNIEAVREDESGELYWHEVWEDREMKDALYLCDPDTAACFHRCSVSALYNNDADFYIDAIQEEEGLDGNELYLVTYYAYDDTDGDLDNRVDFGLTKEEIICNVENQRYREGASYYTLGSVLRTTGKNIELISR